MSVVNFSFSNAQANSRENTVLEVLNGLGLGEIGFVYGPPGVGKSNLCLSISYEICTGINVLGLTPKNSGQMKVLYVPFEDKEHNLYTKILDQVGGCFSPEQKARFEEHFSVYTDYEPLISAQMRRGGLSPSIDRMAEAAKDYHLLILDTARSCLGGLNDVEGDTLLCSALEYIAQKANVAILVCHHLKKSQVSDMGEVNSTGGSGLSNTQSASKYHLLLHKQKNKNKQDSLVLMHTRGNYLRTEDAYTKERPLELYVADSELISIASFETLTSSPSLAKEPSPEFSEETMKSLAKRDQVLSLLAETSEDIPFDPDLLIEVEQKSSETDQESDQDDGLDSMFLS